MLNEFKAFAMRGNVVDLAIGVIIGAAFGKIVDSLVNDIIMPIIGAITGGLDFSNIYIPLSNSVKLGMAYADAKKAGAVMGIGNFINTVVFFLIIAWVLFIVVKAVTRLQRQEAAHPTVPAAPTKEEVLLTEIRDILAAKG
jgi:large conductance mechanosensitive channel